MDQEEINRADHPRHWLHLTDEELDALIRREVLESVQEKARLSTEEFFHAMLAENAAKPIRKRKQVA